ncbi:IS1595 family transposase [Leifsonia sp. L25]|uniref:IS1595 family transposase n=1 Tax=Actinomycetes TaxID=1760 RepID=UPI003D69CEF2
MSTTLSTYEFFEKFPTDAAARQYMEQRRWGGKPDACPLCGVVGRVQTRTRVGFFRCLDCRSDFTVRTGTVFERSHVPLNKWLYAMYLLVTARKGVSSLQLSKEIGVTQKTAWFMLQRLREAAGHNGDGLLGGIVEADEAYFGGRESNKHESRKLRAGRGTVGKTAVLGVRERGGETRAVVIPTASTRVIHEALAALVDPSAMLMTDEHAAYRGAPVAAHMSVNHTAKEFVDGMAHTNDIESVWAVLKRGYYGVYHQFSVKHLQRYVDEFTYRLNEGNVHMSTMQRIDALLGKAEGCRITYEGLTA